MIATNIKLKRVTTEFNLKLYNRVTMIAGDSATGKTVLYKTFQDYSALNPIYKCFNYQNQEILEYQITMCRGNIIVIDNADIILSILQRSKISLDYNNQYIIFGRNGAGLHITEKSYAELKIENNKGRLIYPFM